MTTNKGSSRRFLGMLRNAARSSGIDAVRGPNEPGVLWSLHERAITSTRSAAEAVQRVASNAAKQRGAVDVLADRAHVVAVRVQEAGASAARITDTLERLGLIALNAGLEGARLGEGLGRALLLVSDEVRNNVARATESARELAAALSDVSAEFVRLHGHIVQAREGSVDAAQEAARVATSLAETEGVIVEMGERIERATGSDAETTRAINEAGEHARALVAALGTLSGKVPRTLLVGALRPMLEPLARVLSEADGAVDSETPK